MHRELVRSYLKPNREGGLSVGCHFAVIISPLLTCVGAVRTPVCQGIVSEMSSKFDKISATGCLRAICCPAGF